MTELTFESIWVKSEEAYLKGANKLGKDKLEKVKELLNQTFVNISKNNNLEDFELEPVNHAENNKLIGLQEQIETIVSKIKQQRNSVQQLEGDQENEKQEQLQILFEDLNKEVANSENIEGFNEALFEQQIVPQVQNIADEIENLQKNLPPQLEKGEIVRKALQTKQTLDPIGEANKLVDEINGKSLAPPVNNNNLPTTPRTETRQKILSTVHNLNPY